MLNGLTLESTAVYTHTNIQRPSAAVKAFWFTIYVKRWVSAVAKGRVIEMII